MTSQTQTSPGSSPNSGPPGGATRFLEKLAAVLLATLGGLLIAFMSLAALSEFLLGDFFGVVVSGMVVLFGWLLFRSGYETITGRTIARKRPSPQLDRWARFTKTYPYMPLSRVRAEGR